MSFVLFVQDSKAKKLKPMAAGQCYKTFWVVSLAYWTLGDLSSLSTTQQKGISYFWRLSDLFYYGKENIKTQEEL